MSDIRFNQWLHQSGTGGVSQSDGGHVGIGTTNPLIPVGAGNTHILNVGVVTCNNIAAGSSITAGTFYGSGANLTGLSGVSVANQADNRLITATGTTDALNGEANLSFSGNTLEVNNIIKVSDAGFLKFGVSNTAFVRGKDSTDGYLQLGTNGAERLRISSDGNLLLGTSTAAISAGRGLMIASSTGARIKLCDSDQGVTASDGFEIIQSNGGNAFIYNRENSPIIFGTNNTERMRITHGGSVGIGTDNSTYELEVHDGSGAAALRMKDGANNVICDLIANSTGGLLRTTTNHPLVFHTNQVERMRISNNGKVGINNNNPDDTLDVDGTAQITSNTYIGGDLYMYGNSYGNGVFLGGSNAVHKLDYYKKGTWTPAMWRANHGSEITVGSGNRYGHYIRVGDLLHISFYWYNPSLSSSSGTTWIVRDLPFNLLTGNSSAYQFIPGGYFYQQGNSTGDSGVYGTYRWQANGSLSANTLTLYADNNSRNANGATEFSGTGTLIIA
tara:strand:- start:457 stop:1962 length:1506 start_codon:yes stop_codon:yes gene_type:complete